MYEARVDIAARDFWSTGQKACFDVKGFNRYAKSNQKFTLASCFSHHEKSKKRAYEQRITLSKHEQRIVEVEHGSFPPHVFSTTGGMGRLVSILYSRLALLLAEKRHQPYTQRWDGFDVFYHSPCYAHQFCASVVLDRIKTTFLDFLHPLIWLLVNHVLLSNLFTFSTIIPTFYICVNYICYALFSPLLQYCIVGPGHPAQLHAFYVCTYLAIYCTCYLMYVFIVLKK